MNVKAFSLFVSLCMLPCLAMADSEYDATVAILWGVYPIQDAARATKGTRLVLEGEEPSVDSFRERYSARLLYIGDGACTVDAGYETAVWWGDEADVWDAVEHYGTSVSTVKGRLVLDGSLQKPITTFGDPAADPEGFEAAGFDPDLYFQMKWSDRHLVASTLINNTR